mmetsp:Transcript_56969/g.65671  ORF Transcript_56969/g.65671 Transcript_56969/m.65671 type:complete len:125 (+) Transcript_56969:573-947(+)
MALVKILRLAGPMNGYENISKHKGKARCRYPISVPSHHTYISTPPTPKPIIPKDIMARSDTLCMDTIPDRNKLPAIVADPKELTSEIRTVFQPTFFATGDRAIKASWKQLNTQNPVKTGKKILK